MDGHAIRGLLVPRVLLIEPDRDLREQFRATLELGGWEVAEASCTQAGLQSMQYALPEVVVLTLARPAVDGFQLLQTMMRDERLRRVHRVVISDGGDAVERRFALGLGAAAWLAKPVSPERLLAAAWDHRSDSQAARPVPG